jgi:hypothetical protein
VDSNAASDGMCSVLGSSPLQRRRGFDLVLVVRHGEDVGS